MKNVVFVSVIAIAIAMLSSACHKMDMLDITYPAAFVVNGQSNDIDVINLNDNTHADHISLNGGTFPHHIYLSPNKKWLAVAITSADLSAGHGGHSGGTEGLKVQIIDAITGMIEKEIVVSKMPHNAVFSPNGTELWFGQLDTVQSQVSVYKTDDWSLKNTINVGKGLSEVTFSTDGTKVFAANTMDGTVSIIDPSSKTVLSTVSVGEDPVGAWAASNGSMYVDNEMSKTVSEINVMSGVVTATIDFGFKPGYVAYSDNHSELWVSDATNGKAHYYTLVAGIWTHKGEIVTGTDAHAIAFNAGGTKAYVTNQGANTVSVIDMATHTKSQDITVGTKPNGIAIKE